MKGGVCITRSRNDVARDVPIKSGKLEFVSRTAQRLNDANSEGCTSYFHFIKGGVCVTHGAKKKRCSVEGCTKYKMKGGVCYRHRSKSINAKNNLTLLQLNAGVTPATIPFRQSIEYEDEEELNSWIWKSSHGTRCVA